MGIAGEPFREVWLVDFEFSAPSGERPVVVCLVAKELHSGRLIRLWEDEIAQLDRPPYPTDRQSLFVAYYASAELGCHLALGWPLPECVLDLFVEFRVLTNGKELPCGAGLLGALAWFGLDAMSSIEKTEMRDLAIRGGPYTSVEQTALLDYCQSDVDALDELLPAMEKTLDLPRAILRGRYMKSVAAMEHTGVPIDTPILHQLRDQWTTLQAGLINQIDADFGVYEGRKFKQDRFAGYLANNGIHWPQLESGRLDLTDNTFRDMAKSYPQLAPLRELRYTLSQMLLADLAVGGDGRNRCLLSPFRARTGRNQPSNTRFIFGPSVWLRGLIKPKPGYGLAYVDWSQQEFGIAAALSGDKIMQAAYTSGDPYLAFAKQASAVPEDATKETHPQERDQFKACALAVQYGMGPEALARKIGQSPFQGRELIRLHKETYRQFWRWSDGTVDAAMLKSRIHTVFGWPIHVTGQVNPRSLGNFPMQANGAEMLRLACCLATERGIQICAPVHDAILIEAPLDCLNQVVTETQSAMKEASEIVLDGFPLRSDVNLIKYPDRYSDGRGAKMWETVMALLDESEAKAS